MSAGEGAPGEESQPGTERGWGRWWGVAALGGEATCLGREGSLPGKELRSGQSIQTGEQRKNAEGGTSGRTKGRGSHLTHSYSPTPPTGYILGTGLVSNPTSAGGQETHLSGFTALSFFFGLKSKTDRDKEEENQESPASYSVAPDPRPTPAPPSKSWSPLRCPTTPSTPKAWSLRAQTWGLAGTCIHTGCVLPGTFPPADCLGTGS